MLEGVAVLELFLLSGSLLAIVGQFSMVFSWLQASEKIFTYHSVVLATTFPFLPKRECKYVVLHFRVLALHFALAWIEQ